MHGKHVLVLYDGVCGLCDRTVQFLLKIDRERVLTFAPLQGETAKSIIGRHKELGTVDSIVFLNRPVADERAFVKSTAILRILGEVGGVWGAMKLFLLVPRPIRDAVYDWIAGNRYRWFGKFPACKIPDASVRARFLP